MTPQEYQELKQKLNNLVRDAVYDYRQSHN